jgi:hypothetical protein
VLITYAHAPTHNQVGSLILTLPLSQEVHALTDPQQNVVVFYEVFSDSKDTTVLGVIPTNKLHISNQTVSFSLRGFGIYQAGYLSEPLAKEVNATNDGTVIERNDQSTIVRRKVEVAQSSSSGSSGASSGQDSTATGGSEVNLDLIQGWNRISESAFESDTLLSNEFKIAISPNGKWIAVARAEYQAAKLHVRRISLETKESTNKLVASSNVEFILTSFATSIDNFGNFTAIAGTNLRGMYGPVHLYSLSAIDVAQVTPLPRQSVPTDVYSIANHQTGGIAVVSRETVGESDVGSSQIYEICEAYSFSTDGQAISFASISQSFAPSASMLCGGRQLRTSTGLILAVPYRDQFTLDHVSFISISQESFSAPVISKIADWTLTDQGIAIPTDNGILSLASGADAMPIFSLQTNPFAGMQPGTTAFGGLKSSGATNLILIPEQTTTSNTPIELAATETGSSEFNLTSSFWCTIAGCNVDSGQHDNVREITAGYTADMSNFHLSSFPGGHVLMNLRSSAAIKRNPATGGWGAVQSISGYELVQNSPYVVNSAASPSGLVAVAAKFPIGGNLVDLDPIKVFVFKP